jgi:hypothetical protein
MPFLVQKGHGTGEDFRAEIGRCALMGAHKGGLMSGHKSGEFRFHGNAAAFVGGKDAAGFQEAEEAPEYGGVQGPEGAEYF